MRPGTCQPGNHPDKPDEGAQSVSVPRGPAVLVQGDSGGLGEALIRRLQQRGTAAEGLIPGPGSETTDVLSQTGWAAVPIVTRDDVLALRLTLLCAHVRPDLPLWATLFDKTVVHQIRAVVPSVRVLSPAELVAADLAERCLAAGGCSGGRWRHRVRVVDDALRLLVATGIGLAALVVQAAISMIALHESVLDALYSSTRSVATVADAPNAASASGWFELFSALDTTAALALVAVLTAALVRRLSRPRLTTLFGARNVPARGHVLWSAAGRSVSGSPRNGNGTALPSSRPKHSFRRSSGPLGYRFGPLRDRPIRHLRRSLRAKAGFGLSGRGRWPGCAVEVQRGSDPTGRPERAVDHHFSPHRG